MSTGALLARNTLFNILTQIMVGVMAIVCIPFVVRGIGEEQFGLLTIIWMVVGYFSVLDFGLGQASVKFLAEHFAAGRTADGNRTVIVSIVASAVVGTLGALLIMAVSPLLIERVLRIAPEQISTARAGFILAAAAIPFIMVQASLRAVPMAMQRFDLVNLLQALNGILQWGGAVVLVMLGKGLMEIVVLTVAIRVVGAVAAYGVVRYVFPELRWRAFGEAGASSPHTRATLIKLLRFGGWVSVSQVVTPVVSYLDRLFIGSYLSMRWVAFYSVPFEGLSRLQVIPLGLSTTLFPAIAAGGEGRTRATAELFGRSLRFMMLAFVPLSIVLAVFNTEILTLWLGAGDFPLLSGVVFRLLAIAIGMHALVYVPLTVLQASGRPDIVAKFNLLEIPVYVLLCVLLIPALGIEGAALAWLIRLTLLLTALLLAVYVTLRGAGNPFREFALWKALALNLLVLVLMLALKGLSGSLLLTGAVMLVVAGLYLATAWRFCLDMSDRGAILRVLPGFGR